MSKFTCCVAIASAIGGVCLLFSAQPESELWAVGIGLVMYSQGVVFGSFSKE